MDYRISSSFTDSLGHLTGEEQKAVKTTAFDLQLNPANPGMSFHRIERAKDKGFWSVRVNDDIRLIVHRSDRSLLLCYVGHHDQAYAWAERRKLEVHPKTGAAQLVEIRETVKEVVVPVYKEGEPERRRPAGEPERVLAGVTDEELLGYGVPPEWLGDVKAAAEDSLLSLVEHLPDEAAEALLELATGGKPTASVAAETTDPLDHPDAQRRFRVMQNLDELERALDYPWDKWTVFLHPDQRELVQRRFTGPARVSGSAGTGKTVVALHRAVHLARTHSDARILLTTFSDALANALSSQLRRLTRGQPRLAERIDVHSLDAVALRLYAARWGQPRLASSECVRDLVTESAQSIGDHNFSLPFLLAEWEQVVDAWQLNTWEAYRSVVRLGRKTRLPEARRAVLWSLFQRVRDGLEQRGVQTLPQLLAALAGKLSQQASVPYDFAVVDEAQDISVAQLRFLAILGRNRPNALFFAGDLGQRIFRQPFSWKSLGVDVQGRARTLRVNYRTSHQIRQQADRLLAPELSDVDGNRETRKGTVSVFNGPRPVIRRVETEEEEIRAVAEWLASRVAASTQAHEVGVFVRSSAQLERARRAVEAANLPLKLLDQRMEPARDRVVVSTMHLAKGLEFRAVAVMACDDEVIPLQQRIEGVGDDADLEEVYNTERHLLYVACTRARDYLMVSGVEPVSEFVDDMS